MTERIISKKHKQVLMIPLTNAHLKTIIRPKKKVMRVASNISQIKSVPVQN